MAHRKTRHEEAHADGSPGPCPDPEGGRLPAAAGSADAAPASPAPQATHVTDGPEMPRIGREKGDFARFEPWSRAGVPAEGLVFPATATRKDARTGFLGRLRGSVSENGSKIAVPINLRPWTWEILPHVTETREGSRMARLLDRIAWFGTLPDARYVLHAERLQRRRESLVAWSLVRFAASVARRPSGSPRWISEGSRSGET